MAGSVWVTGMGRSSVEAGENVADSKAALEEVVTMSQVAM